MDMEKDKIKAALLGELIRYMGKTMVSSLADPENEKSVSLEVEAEPKEEGEEEAMPMGMEDSMEEDEKDEKAKRLKKLKSLAMGE